MIGTRTLGALALAAGVVLLAATRGWLAAAHLEGLSAASCIAAGAFVGLTAALLAAAVRPGRRSRTGLGVRGQVIRELPGPAQRILYAAAFACLALGVFDNDATARLTGLPAALATASPSEFCLPEAEAPPAPTVAAPAVAPGCALMVRAYQLGYARSLGSCAPRQVTPARAVRPTAICTRRQLDEPFGHFAWRRLASAAAALAKADPFGRASHRADEMRTKLRYIDTLMAQHLHAITSSPRASHHLWINLPDPRDSSWLADHLDPPRCETRYADLPLWRRWTNASALVDDVFGQLLFSPSFGQSPGNCHEYTVHWGAPEDACRRLLSDPAGFLSDQGVLDDVRDVLDRHRRQIELARLAADLGRPAVSAPPDPRTLVSLQCFSVGRAEVPAHPTEQSVTLDGTPVAVRELRAPPVRLTGAGPLEVYAELAALLAPGHYSGPAREASLSAPPVPGDLSHETYLLTRLDRVRDADPFLGASWPLEQSDLMEVYPLRRHLVGFIDAFRRRYFAQRGRL